MEPGHDGERVEFVPWDQVSGHPPVVLSNRYRLGAALVGAALVIGAAIWVAARPTRSPSDARPPIESSTVEIDPADPGVTFPLPPSTAAGYAEADLRAVTPATDQMAIAAGAAEFLRDYLMADRPDIHPFGQSDRTLYVEWMIVSAVEATSGDDWTVELRVGILEMGAEPERWPTITLAVPVTVDGGEVRVGIPMRVADRPASGAYVFASPEPATLPSDLAATLDGAGEILGGWEDGEGWHAVVRDDLGFPVRVDWLGAEVGG